jgi:NADH:quinone reductase (non-electrogenic)
LNRIVILGAGFAGAYCAQALERKRKGAPVEIVLLDRNNYFVFHPLLVEAGAGSLEPRHAVVSIRAFLKSTTFRMADVVSVDTAGRRVVCRIAGESTTMDIATWCWPWAASRGCRRFPGFPASGSR